MDMSTGHLNRVALHEYLSGPDRKMTKKAFAEKMDVAPGTVSRWLAGHWSPAESVVREMAELLDVDFAELWTSDSRGGVSSRINDSRQDMYEQRLRELIAGQPEHVKAEILAMVARELASRGPSGSGADDSTKDDE